MSSTPSTAFNFSFSFSYASAASGFNLIVLFGKNACSLCSIEYPNFSSCVFTLSIWVGSQMN